MIFELIYDELQFTTKINMYSLDLEFITNIELNGLYYSMYCTENGMIIFHDFDDIYLIETINSDPIDISDFEIFFPIEIGENLFFVRDDIILKVSTDNLINECCEAVYQINNSSIFSKIAHNKEHIYLPYSKEIKKIEGLNGEELESIKYPFTSSTLDYFNLQENKTTINSGANIYEHVSNTWNEIIDLADPITSFDMGIDGSLFFNTGVNTSTFQFFIKTTMIKI